MKLGYELLTSISARSLGSRVQDVLDNGWVLRNYPAVRLDQVIPWALQDNSQRSWNFHIHCWDMLEDMLAAYSIGLKPELLEISVRIALDWAAHYGDKAGAETNTIF